MANNNPAPFNTPMYDNGTMTPAWLAWFNGVAAQTLSDAAAVNPDDVLEILKENLPEGALDFTPPPILTGFKVTDGYSTIFIEWDQPTYNYFSHVEVYRSVSPMMAQAIQAGTTMVNIYGDIPPRTEVSQTFYYWARAVSKAGVKGPFNAVLGTPGKTATDPEFVINQLAAALNDTEAVMSADQLVFEAETFAIRTTDQHGAPQYPFIVDKDWGVVINTLLVKEASITNAMIGSVSADKILAGVIRASIEIVAPTITGGNINGGTITGGIFQTNATGRGNVVIANDQLTVRDNNGVVRVRMGRLN